MQQMCTQAFSFANICVTASHASCCSSQVEKTQSVVKKEQSLAAKLKEEISVVNNNAQKQMQLEKEKAEATESEKALVEKSLDAERQKVTMSPHA